LARAQIFSGDSNGFTIFGDAPTITVTGTNGDSWCGTGVSGDIGARLGRKARENCLPQQ
jgi:hypothetical protein